jgi:hypothetical protein
MTREKLSPEKIEKIEKKGRPVSDRMTAVNFRTRR